MITTMTETKPVITETKPVITETKPVITETKKKVVSLILTHQARIRCLFDMIIKGKRIEKKENMIDKIKNNETLNNSLIFVKNTINTAQTKIANTIQHPDDPLTPRLYNYLKKEKEEEKRFQNCSILRLCLKKETGLCLQLVYGGELDPGEGKGGRIYYITGKEDDKKQIGGDGKISKIIYKFVPAMSLTCKKEVTTTEEENDEIAMKIIEEIFTNINAGINRLELQNNIFKDVDEYVFYIGRHGQAQHNLKNATHLKTDTDVTDLGKEQAFRAGQNLSNVLKNNRENISYVFASDLIRTRQTIENIIKGMNSNKNQKQMYFPKEIVILPCSHELKYNSKGLCDKKPASFSLKIGTKENDPKCSKTTYCVDNNITNPESDCHRIKMIYENPKNKIVRNIPLQWDFYFEKNKDKMRNMDCSKTNMIQLAIEYINTSGPIRFNKTTEIDNKSRVVTKIPTPVQPIVVEPIKEPIVDTTTKEAIVEPEEKKEEKKEEKPIEKVENTEKSNGEENIKFWVGLFNTNKETFYKDIKDLSSRNRNVFDKVMDQILSDPKQLYNMIQEYKSNKNTDDHIGFISDYLGYRLKYEDKNAEKFMKYIKSKDEDLYNNIESGRQKGGKKTRKNRKAKKRFVKRTKRNYNNNKNKNKSRRTRR